jgi:hypothetical protein
LPAERNKQKRDWLVVFLWLLAAAVIAGAITVQIVDKDKAVPPLLVALALLVIAIATPGAKRLVDRLSEVSAGGVSLKLSVTAETVEQRLELPASETVEEPDEGDQTGRGFIKEYSEETAALSLMTLQDWLGQRLRWMQDELKLPEHAARTNLSRIEGLRYEGLLLPDEADLLKVLNSATPKQVGEAHERDPRQLLALVRSIDTLLWRIRRIVFERRVRQVFAKYPDVWRVFDWEPQPSGRPWFMAHVDQRDGAADGACTVVIAPRVAPTEKGLRGAITLLREHRTEIPSGAGLPGVVVLRDSYKRLDLARELSDEKSRALTLRELEELARTHTLPELPKP